jgi:RNA recognition motif-containing protein
MVGPFHSRPGKQDRVAARSSRSFKVGKKLYVGNLTYQVGSSDLEQLFSRYGTVVSAQVITDRETGRAKGFGFVEMSTDAEAEAAIRELNDQEHDGRRLTVNEAKPREARTTRSYGNSNVGQRY